MAVNVVRSDILFRVDGARIRGLSLGHVYRCLALAHELRNGYGIKPGFLMKNYEVGVALVENSGFPVERLEPDISSENEIHNLRKWCGTKLVVDLPGGGGLDLVQLAEEGRTVIVIDDLGGGDFKADMVINASINPVSHKYPAGAAACSYYLGPDYCVMGPEFDIGAERKARGDVEKILVTFGGSDPTGLTLKVAAMLSDAPSLAATVHVVTGPGFADGDKLRRVINEGRTNFVLHHNVPDLAAMMREADMAIAAAGRTAYELAALGTPALLIPSIEHERATAAAFAEAGCALAVEGWIEDEVQGHLSRLLKDVELRSEMRHNGPLTIDGKGRQRVASLLNIGA